MGYIYNTPDRGNTSSQVSVGALKEIHFPIQLGNNKKGDIFIEIHDPKERRQQEKQYPDTPILKGSNHFGQVNYIDNDERFGSPHAVAVARVRSFHSELSSEDLRLAAVCLIHLSNTIERIRTIHDHINKNNSRSINKFEKRMQKTHIHALAIETSRLDEALETLRCRNALFAELIEQKLAVKIPNYGSYVLHANDKEHYENRNKPYEIFSDQELDSAEPLNETEIIKPEPPDIRFPSHLFGPPMGDHAQLSDTLSPDGIKGKKQGSEQSTIIKPEAPDIGFPKGALDKDDQNLNPSTQSLCESDNNQEDENENQDPNQRYLSTKIPYQNSNCIFTHKPSCTTDQNECPKNDQASAATN